MVYILFCLLYLMLLLILSINMQYWNYCYISSLYSKLFYVNVDVISVYCLNPRWVLFSFFWYFVRVNRNFCVIEKCFLGKYFVKKVKKLVSSNPKNWNLICKLIYWFYSFIKQQQHKQLYFRSQWSNIFAYVNVVVVD